MLREQCPTKLANVGLERNSRENDKESAKLLAIREKQVREKMEKMKKYAGSRYDVQYVNLLFVDGFLVMNFDKFPPVIIAILHPFLFVIADIRDSVELMSWKT